MSMIQVAAHVGQQSRPTILVWAALSTGKPLDYANIEIRHLENLGKLGFCRVFVVRNRPWQQLPEALIKYAPDIFHFIGHGDHRGRLTFNETSSSGIQIEPEELMGLLEVAPHGGPHGLFLSACWTSVKAPHFTPIGGWLVSMNSIVMDDVAGEFSKIFYSLILDPVNPASPNHALESAKDGLLESGAFSQELVQSLWFKESGPVVIGEDLSYVQFINTVFNRAAFRTSAINEITMDSLRIAIGDVKMALLTGKIVIRETRETFLMVHLNKTDYPIFSSLFGEIIQSISKLESLINKFIRDFPDSKTMPLHASNALELEVPRLLNRLDALDLARNRIIKAVNDYVVEHAHLVLAEITPSSLIYAAK